MLELSDWDFNYDNMLKNLVEKVVCIYKQMRNFREL